MKRLALVILLALTGTAMAQERRTNDADVLTPGTNPAPGYPFVIIVPWGGNPSQIHFRVPFKSIRIGDAYTAAAEPQTDHIVSITGRSPGETSLVLESKDSKDPNWVGTIKVVRQVREVKIYTPKPGAAANARGGGSGITIINGNGNDPAVARESDEAEYKSILCNEISCRPTPKPGT